MLGFFNCVCGCGAWSGRAVHDGSDTGAANLDPHLLQPEGIRTALGLPPEDQDFLMDGNGVHGAVFLPLGIDAA